ncbi:FAD/NAD(P)-binding domain-containing protein [Neolentinus lepideus HHB14362 ss-1]|uniref:FAD/NAD(P)-binding domain-containing protein n=1 Tax=Neolentinus lepideus HHB14362 ss-1 TaxID=1314782 RepID=A0A165LTI5_9AGAM|nr:FAD/NAD(P)-binding domain-containing protein [Neolentinus lepideus HHB14362 ss-1]KZT17496.1 FAD/NAD(P)-binding domain-containing protein [Neolentinus lepideus HHB14362 ss-1]
MQAGAGPAGLVLAITLRQNGVPVRIIDKEPTYHIGARASGIMPRTLEIYEFLGVLPDIMKASMPPIMICSYDPLDGTNIAEAYPMFPHNDPAPDRPYLNPRILAQNLNQAILRFHLAKYDCRVELGTELRDFEDKGHHIAATLVQKGLDGGEVTESYVASYLVGTDGARGIVRKMLGMTFDGEPYEGLNMVVADIRLHGLEGSNWHKWGEMSDRLIVMRKTEEGDKHWLLAGGRAMDTSNLRGEPALMTQWIADVTGRRDIEVTEVLTFAYYKPQMRMVKEFSRGRVYLAGDAAHVHSPAGGQGMNNGIADAFSLAWRLSLAYRSLASADLMVSYTAERAPVIKAMLQRTTAILEDSSISWGKFALKMGRKDRLPLFQLDLNYRWSPVILEEASQGRAPSGGFSGSPDQAERIHAGDRAPDAPGLVDLTATDDPAKRLFQYFKPTHHTVLIFSSSEAAISSFVLEVQKVPASAVRSVVVIPGTISVRPDNIDFEFVWRSMVDYSLKDCEGHAYNSYSVGSLDGDVAVIVRPDGVIGGIVEDGNGVAKYFQRILAV